MRQKLNESQAAQIGVVAVLVVVALIFFLKSSGGEEEESGGAVATVNGETATGETPGAAVDAAIAGIEAGGAEAAAVAPSSIPAPPPPAAFTAAYDSGRTVVLLVHHDGGIDDRLTAKAAGAIEGMAGVALIRVPLQQLPRYAAITLGVELNRVPALVVVRPRRVSHGVPQASVDYGFQTHQSLVQAVRDASYRGPEATYHPG